uniref:Cytochrome P450 n=1 Tax=Oryza punctata TaxID=4537 RepID=A0A0E0JTT7_ORYPU
MTAFFSRENTNLPPGPWPLPVIGSMHCLLGSLPHHALRRLAGRYGPVMLLRVGHVLMLVLSSPEAAREVMKTHDAVFASRPLTPTMDIITYGGKGVALSPYGQRWKELRKICAVELLSPRRVRSFSRVREAEAARLVRAVAASPTWPLVNVSEHVAAMMNAQSS